MKTIFLIVYSLFSSHKETLCLPDATINITNSTIEILTDKDPVTAFKYIDDTLPIYMDNHNITIINSEGKFYVEEIDYKRNPKIKRLLK